MDTPSTMDALYNVKMREKTATTVTVE